MTIRHWKRNMSLEDKVPGTVSHRLSLTDEGMDEKVSPTSQQLTQHSDIMAQNEGESFYRSSDRNEVNSCIHSKLGLPLKPSNRSVDVDITQYEEGFAEQRTVSEASDLLGREPDPSSQGMTKRRIRFAKWSSDAISSESHERKYQVPWSLSDVQQLKRNLPSSSTLSSSETASLLLQGCESYNNEDGRASDVFAHWRVRAGGDECLPTVQTCAEVPNAHSSVTGTFQCLGSENDRKPYFPKSDPLVPQWNLNLPELIFESRESRTGSNRPVEMSESQTSQPESAPLEVIATLHTSGSLLCSPPLAGPSCGNMTEVRMGGPGDVTQDVEATLPRPVLMETNSSNPETSGDHHSTSEECVQDAKKMSQHAAKPPPPQPLPAEEFTSGSEATRVSGTHENNKSHQEGVRGSHPMLRFLLDIVIMYFLLGPMVVFYWRCTWILSDHHFQPHPQPLYSCVCIAGGYVIRIMASSLQCHLTSMASHRSSVFRFFMTRVYTYVLAIVCVTEWRGLWGFHGWLLGSEWEANAITVGVCSLLLMLFRSHKCTVSAPAVLALDGDLNTHFKFSTFFMSNSGTWFLVLDAVFTVVVVNSLGIVMWKGIWTYLDRTLYPDNNIRSAFACMVIAYGLAIILLVLQGPSKRLSSKLEGIHWLLKLAFEDVITFLYTLMCVTYWRCFWLFMTEFVPEPPMYEWIIHSLVVILLMLAQCSNSLLVRGCPRDGMESGGQGVVFDMFYVTHMVNRYRAWTQPKESDHIAGLTQRPHELSQISSVDSNSNLPYIISSNGTQFDLLAKPQTVNSINGSGDFDVIRAS